MNRKPHSYSSVELGNVSGLVSPPALTPGCLRGIHKNRLMPLGEHYNKITIIIPPQTICTAYKALVHCFICGNFYNPLTLGATETREVKKNNNLSINRKVKTWVWVFQLQTQCPSCLPNCPFLPFSKVHHPKCWQDISPCAFATVAEGHTSLRQLYCVPLSGFPKVYSVMLTGNMRLDQ